MNTYMAKKWPEKVVQRSFIKGHSFPIGLYLIGRNYITTWMEPEAVDEEVS